MTCPLPRTAVLLAALSGLGSLPAEAATLRYDFQDFWGDILAPAAVPARLTASKLNILNAWGGLCWNTDVGGSNDFACGGFGSSTLAFSVTADAGWQFDLQSFRFQGLGPNDNGTAPTAYAVYSSLDNFSQALIGGSLLGQTIGQRYDYDAGLSAANLQSIELRIVSLGRDDLPASAWLVDNLLLELNTERIGSVPLPPSLALGLLALGLAAGVGRRRALRG
jgi:hypothetical protein